MKANKMGLWIRAIRPFSLTGSSIPVILGAVLALKQGEFHMFFFLLSVIAIMLLHSGVNLLSDHDDFVNKVDTENSHGSSGVILEDLLKPEQISRAGKGLLIIGVLLGLFLSYERGWVVLLIEFIGAFGGYSYTGKPLSLKYRGLGAPLVFLIFGPLMVTGSYYVQAQTISFAAIAVSVPLGLLTTAILHVNDIRDIVHDKKAGIKTLSIVIGKSKAKKVFYGLIIFSYLSLLLMTFYRIIPYWSLICFITVGGAIKIIRKLHLQDNEDLNIITLDKETGQLQGQFGILLIISILIPGILR